MPIRLSGINSGLDTDALVKELVSAYSLKTEKYQKEQTKIEWKQDAWKNLNTKIYGLYTSASNLRFDSAYNLKRTSVSDATKATVTASSDAVAGTQKLQIISTAQACYITGAKLGEGITKSSTLKDLGYTGDETTIKVKSKNGDVKEIAVTSDMKISELVSKFQEAGLNASFDEKNARFFLSAKESGDVYNFDIEAGDGNTAGNEVLAALGLTSSEGTRAALESQAAAYKQAVQDFAALKATYGEDESVYQSYITAYEKAETRYNARVALENIVAAANAAEGKTGTFSAKELMNKVNAGEDLDEYLKSCGLTEDEIKAVADDVKTVKGYSSEKNGGILSATSAQLKEELNGTLKDNYDIAMEYNKLKDKIESTTQDVKDLADGTKNITDLVDTDNTATKIKGSDAEIILNGAKFTSTSNSFSINGLTIEALGETDGEISITTSVDTQGIYDKIKDFLTEYNNVINEIAKLYNAESAGEYEPLTDEEKDAMSDEQVEKWENKIKDSLLRRDSSLGTIMNAMVNSMSQAIEIDGQRISLSNFGISTLGFLNAAKNEHYAFHIDGDQDDEKTSGKEDKLMKAIQENPDQICEFMKKLTGNLYTAIDNKMKSTELSSAYKVYNDKELDSQLKKHKELIEKWEEKVKAEEEYYYDKFSSMEVALSKLQSQTNALSGLIGQ